MRDYCDPNVYMAGSRWWRVSAASVKHAVSVETSESIVTDEAWGMLIMQMQLGTTYEIACPGIQLFSTAQLVLQHHLI